jgi:glucose/arabinose dehydrogenase
VTMRTPDRNSLTQLDSTIPASCRLARVCHLKRMRLVVLAFAFAVIACDAHTGTAADADWQTASPNAQGQHPAFPGQTRAPVLHSQFAIREQVVARHLAHPWGIAFLPDGRMLVTERAGRIRIITQQGAVSPPLLDLPPVAVGGQGGLLDIAVTPDFAHDRWVYWSYSERRGASDEINGTSVARARLSTDERSLENPQVIFRQQPAWRSTEHFGSRLVFDGDGHLFVALGERYTPQSRQMAQTLDNDFGKVVRINLDGTIPRDNPFVGRPNARPEIWNYGHRNMQGADINPATGVLWTIEHGPRGGDEVNVARAGLNYGWPIITYGEDYSGAPIGAGITRHESMEQPLYYWDPVIAPSGAHFYRGTLFSGWRNDLLIAGLVANALVRLKLNGEHVVGEERVVTDQGRVRDVAEASDGALWIVTDDDDGKLIRLTPQ